MDVTTIGKIISDLFPGLFILDEKGITIWADQVAIKVSGNSEPIKAHFSDFFQVKVNDLLNSSIFVKGEKGEKYRLRAHKTEIEDQKYTIVLTEEITDLYKTESRLRCLESIINKIDDGVMMSDHEGKIVLYNDALAKMEDMSVGTVVGTYLWEAYNYYEPEEYEKKSEHRKVFTTGEPLLDRYRAYLFKDGKPNYLSCNTYPITMEGEVIGVYSILKNESHLQSLLSNIIEIKRNLITKEDLSDCKQYRNGTRYTFTDIVSDSDVIKELIRDSQMIASLDSSVLIIGETGTGKEVFAQSIHNFGNNEKEPFIAVNCAAIPETLMESILFGTVKGAFTGAIDQIGLFEEAHSGTLFLDEINSMSIALQSKLLRVLHEMTIRRVGGLDVIPIHCRVICSTNEDPQGLIAEDRLRQDLFYRIARFSLYIPPLRERQNDIIYLAEYFIKRYNKLLNKKVKSISKELQELMLSYKWLGNIRELEHVIENIMIRVEENESQIAIMHLPIHLKDNFLKNEYFGKAGHNKKNLTETLKDIEKKMILESLKKNHWNYTKTAQELGIIRQSLKYRMKKLGIDTKKQT